MGFLTVTVLECDLCKEEVEASDYCELVVQIGEGASQEEHIFRLHNDCAPHALVAMLEERGLPNVSFKINAREFDNDFKAFQEGRLK